MSNDLIPNVITGGCVFRTEHKDLAPLYTSLLDELPPVDWAPGPLVPPRFRSPVQHQVRLSPMIPKRDKLHHELATSANGAFYLCHSKIWLPTAGNRWEDWVL